MFCKHCGARIDDNSAFCPVCGGALGSDTARGAGTAPAQPAGTDSPVTLMVLGIIALALCEIGLPGLIIGAIDKKKVQAYLDAGLPVTAMVRLGSIFSKIAYIVGLVMTIVWAVLIVIYTVLIIPAVIGGISFGLGGLLALL